MARQTRAVYNATHGSLLIAALFHASMNAWSNILPFPAQSTDFWWTIAIVHALVIGAILIARLLRAPRSVALEQELPVLGAISALAVD